MTKPLTAERLRALVRYDEDSGLLVRTVAVGRQGCHRVGEPLGFTRKSDGYRRATVDSVKYEYARLVWLYKTGNWPVGDVDHIDGDPQNNRWSNLRDVPHAVNIENRTRANSNNKIKLLGVSPEKTRPGWYRSQITVKGKNKWLGCFPSPEQAHDAYLQAKRQLHQGNTL